MNKFNLIQLFLVLNLIFSQFLLIDATQPNKSIGKAFFYSSNSSIGKATYTSFATTAACFCYDSDTLGKQALTYTNNFRAKNGKPAVKWSQHISNLAKIHSQNMGNKIVPFGHTGFDCRVSCLGNVPVRAAGENVFKTSSTGNIPQQAVNAWINSPEHRANLLGNFSNCGIAFFRTNNGVWYVTQTFALF